MAVGNCEVLEIQIEGFSTMVEVYVLELEGGNVVVGEAWLHKLGKVRFDWDARAIHFVWKEEDLTLQCQDPKGPFGAHNKQTGYDKTILSC
jgi:hypothetical protein